MKTVVSVIIPTYNEEKDIVEALKSLQKQSYKNFEVIVVDDGSTDKTIEIVKKFKKVRVIKGQHKGPGFSRNLGAKKAKGKILVFVDADMTFEKNYLKYLVGPILENKDIRGTTHELEIVKNTTNIWSRCWGKIRVSKEEAKDVKIFRAIQKKDFLGMGGFDPKYGYADDQTFWFKCKVKPIVAKKTVCYHKNPETLKGVYKQSKWIGASIDSLLIKIPIIKFFIPFILLLGSPLLVPLLSIKKCFKNKDLSIVHWMLVFMTARHLGTVSGLFRKIFWNKNVR